MQLEEKFWQEIQEIYNKIPKKEKTWMEIAGYPHYENVCSNILAFYLNPKEEHGLEGKMLKALCNAIKEKSKDSVEEIHSSNITIFREYTTLKGNRIDLVLQSDEMVIGIENKIMASLYNDLEDYAKTLEKINPNAVKIVLSLQDESSKELKGGFINVTYREFFQHLKQELTPRNNKWYVYLIDFIKNLEGVGDESEVEVKINEWIKGHKEDINKLNEILNVAKNNMMKKASEYGTMLEGKIESQYKVKYAKEEMIEITSYIVFDIGCNLDAKLTIDGWKIGVFLWKKMNQMKIKQTLKENGYDSLEEENNHIWLFQFDYDTPIEQIVNVAKEIKEVIQQTNR